MSDPRGRGRGPRPQDFGSRPLGRMPDFAGGRAGMGRGPGAGSRPLGQPVRSSSGSLGAAPAGGLGAAIAAGQGAAGAAGAAAAAAAAGAGGRGAGPDHREVRYADGVLAMINVLRLLTLGGPRTWDAGLHKQLGMQAAPRQAPGVAGREVNLMVNHFALSIRPGSSMAVYSVSVTRSSTQQQEEQQQQQEAAGSAKQQLPRGLVRRLVAQLAADAGWPSGWLLLGGDRLAAGRAFLPTNVATEAVVTLQQQQQQQHGQEPGGAAGGGSSSSGSSETFKVVLSYLGSQDINALRSTAAADAAADAAAAAGTSPASTAGLLDGVTLLEALLMAAALQQPPKQQQQQQQQLPAAPASSAPVPVPGAAAAAAAGSAAAGSAPVGSAGAGLMGLAGTPGATQQQQLLGMALPGIVGSAGSPAAAPGLLAASIASSSMPAAAGAAPAAAGSGLGSSMGGGSSSSAAICAALAELPRRQVGRSVFLQAPGNPELHAPLGGGVEGWLGFRQRLADTQAGPALVMDLTAAPFLEPGPLLSALPALLGRPAALLPPGAAAASAGNHVAGLEDGLGGEGSGSAAASAAASALAPLSPAEHARLQQQLKGVKVEVALPGAPPRLHTVAGLSPGPAAATSFSLARSCAAGAAGSTVSVAQYFAAAHGLTLAAPQLPCVDVGHSSGSSSGDGEGGSRQHIWYPLELCSLPPGQRYAPPLEQQQLAALARLGAKKPGDRRAWLEALTAPLAAAAAASAPLPVPGAAAEPGSAAGNGVGGGEGSALAGSGVEVSGLLGIVRGRVLPAPHLAYQQPECCYPGSQGQWNVKSCKLPGASRIASWALVVLMPQAQADVEGPSGVVPFVADLRDSLRGMGLEAELPPIVYETPGLSVLQHLRAGCEAAQKQFNASPELLLVMLPSRSAALYSEVKLASDAALGLPSQVLVAPVAGVGRGAAPRGRLQYCANLGLKINAKLGGVNMRLAGNPDQVIPVVGGRPFILFGLALAPPAPNAPPGAPAAAAVVASRDRSLGRYSSRVLLQPWQPQQQQQQAAAQLDAGAASSPAAGAADPQQQQQQQRASSPWVIQGLRGAAKELLIDFYRQNGGRKPEALLVYRAASEEGQGPGLVADEYEALRAACFELEEGYCPPITYVTVSRAHSTRLFPADRDNQDKSGNVLPGTVVDSGICHPSQFDFFLNSHAGLQGTNKPAHYHVLVDENAFSADGLQLLTYWLCYLYCRCTRSVSVVPPAYYAQLAAARGRLIASCKDSVGGGAAAGEAGGADADAGADAGLLDFDVRVNARLGGSMYYV
uniref:Piwi domain-containing protein n=1 Tax=Tetradesmus obliquus TaxID=3088 RepID=A0A383VYD8_TETOB|eukprot:jgi/Sobl393_1/13143/SZX69832.1